MTPDLRPELTVQREKALAGKLGVWKVDRSMNCTQLRGLPDLEAVALWPKLFRRLVKWFDTGATSLAGFDAWLREKGKDRDDALFIPETAELGNLHDVVEVEGGRIRMVSRVEGIMVVS